MSNNEGHRTALGNRLKELRNKHNLTISGLSEILGISHSYVGFLEKGTRKGSEEILKKYADFFRVPLEELLDLQSQLVDSSKIATLNQFHNNPENIEELNGLLLKLSEEIRNQLIQQFKEQIQKTLYNLLTPYDISDIKRNISKIKKAWFSEQDDEEVKNQKGYISLPSGQMYFELLYKNSVLNIYLLYEDRKQLSLFENWLGECSVSYATEAEIQHINEPQKMLHVLWFSPNLSYRQQYQYLTVHGFNLSEIQCSDPKLSWFIHNYHSQNTIDESEAKLG
jgi:transcriptional regulator with XRE-family HTH domain